VDQGGIIMKPIEHNIHIKDFFPAQRAEVFNFFTNPRMLEKWACPDNMELKIPYFEPKEGGRYRFEHTTKDGGVFTCVGSFITFDPLIKIDQIESVYGPDGKPQFENIQCTVDFLDVNGGTEIILNHRGFKDERSMNMCEMGWNQTLEKLHRLIASDITDNSEGHIHPDHGKYTSFY
jgi:uncharacterized protein YndB with AHSA1/START domain